MSAAPLPPDEAERLAALRALEILDTEPEQAFDDLTRLTATLLDVPVALVSLVDHDRQWFKSCVGLDVRETSRDVAFCAHAILEPDEPLVVEDAREDPRFRDNPLVTGPPHVRFYAGQPLVDGNGRVLGTLCAIGYEPREFTAKDADTLRALGGQASGQLELRRALHELSTASARLALANRQLEEFTRVAAHDLKAPLRHLSLFASMLEEAMGEDRSEEVADAIDGISRAARRMDSLVTKLLELSRITYRDLDRAPVDLRRCVDAALEDLAPLIAETGARVEVDELPTVSADATLMTQVFQNLLSNALKYSEGVPHVRVTCDRSGGEPVIGVEDAGVGIAKESLEEIFEPFHRLDDVSTEGSGIGLATVRNAVQRLGGRLWVESEPGKGSHFRFTCGEALTPAR